MAMDASMHHMLSGEWSSSDIALVKSLIATENKTQNNNGNNLHHDDDGNGNNNNNNNNNTYDGNVMMKNKHENIVDVIHAQFPWKDRHQVTDLYVDIVVEMVQCQAKVGTTEPTMGGVDLVNDNFGMPAEVPTMENMEVLPSPLKNAVDMRAKIVEKQSPRRRALAPQRERHAGRFWSTEEHRSFLRGLSVYGHGNWKDISKYFVKTRTPVQVSSHAQKYFRQLENATTKQRYSINDVGLYDVEPWGAPSNSFGWDTLAFPGGGYNSKSQGFTQHSSINNLAQVWSPVQYHANEASTSHIAWTDGQQMGNPAATPQAVKGTMNFTLGDQQGASTSQNWMNNMYY